MYSNEGGVRKKWVIRGSRHGPDITSSLSNPMVVPSKGHGIEVSGRSHCLPHRELPVSLTANLSYFCLYAASGERAVAGPRFRAAAQRGKGKLARSRRQDACFYFPDCASCVSFASINRETCRVPSYQRPRLSNRDINLLGTEISGSGLFRQVKIMTIDLK